MSQILVGNQDKTTNNVKYLTPEEFEAEWIQLFPLLADQELPSLIRLQAD
jgi:hypothetical protein